MKAEHQVTLHEILRLLRQGKGKEIVEILDISDEFLDEIMKALDMKTPKQCPNGCGLMVEFEKSPFITPTEDAVEYLQNIPEDKYIYMKMLRACPKCGFYEVEEVTQKAFEAFEEELKAKK
jgi:hypothetical protein